MIPLKDRRRALRSFQVPNPILVFKDLVGIAVTSNLYDQNTELFVLLCLQAGRYRELVIWADAVAATEYGDPEQHYRMHQLSDLIRKYPFPPKLLGLNPREAAKEKFVSAEHRCERVNTVFRARNSGRGRRFHTELAAARKWIEYVVGESPNLHSIASKMDFSGGASIGVHGNATNLARKIYAPSWSATPGCVSYALGGIWANFHLRELLLENDPTSFRLQNREVDGESYADKIICHCKERVAQRVAAKVQYTCHNKISFVPKTAKTHRAIAVEPTLNTFVQHGIEQELKDRLRRVGLDLSNQSKNQELARLGTLEDEDPYCTIDLSSASDTLATEVVRHLLPPEWFDLMNRTRSPSYSLDGVVKRYHKFVSMGNGFCFPLETLIFASLCHTAAVSLNQRPDFRVYGDDIIVRRSVFHRTLQLLKCCGFSPNPKKTFFEGPFRESCGADWYLGENVRPLVLDGPFDNLGKFFSFHNESIDRESRHYEYFREIRSYLRKQVPKALRFVVRSDPGPVSFKVAQRIRDEHGIRDDGPVRSSGQEDFFQALSSGQVPTTDSAFFVEQDVFLSSDATSFNRDTQSWQTYLLRRSGVTDSVADVSFRGESLHHMACLRGSLSSKPFTLRYSAQDKIVLV